jgi:hypothetical protein
MDTVVEVGRPNELKISKSKTSVSITAKKIIMTSSKVNMAGLKIPSLAISIMPLENSDPTKTPKEATIIVVLKLTAFEPMAEFKKLTASLLTPTTKSKIASSASTRIITKYICSI